MFLYENNILYVKYCCLHVNHCCIQQCVQHKKKVCYINQVCYMKTISLYKEHCLC